MVYQRKRPALDPCPVETVFGMVAGKWKARVLYMLSLDTLTFGEIRASVGDIRQQVLSAALGQMAASGIVRRVENGEAGEVRYALTPRGRELVVLLQPVADWGAGILREQGAEWRAPVPARKTGRAPARAAGGSAITSPSPYRIRRS